MVTAKGPSLRELFEKVKADRRAREAQAEALASRGKSVRFTRPDGRKALVSPDLGKPGIFRLTYFDDRGPSGHLEFRTQQEALEQALRDRYIPR